MSNNPYQAGPHHYERRRGVAMLTAIVVLAALFLLALPFAVFMRLQHASGTQALHTARARYGEKGALNHALRLLYSGLETPPSAFPFDNPDVDTVYEFHVTLRTVAPNGIGDGSADRTFAVDDALGLPNDGNPDTVDGYIRVRDEWMAYSDVTGLGMGSVPGGTLHVKAVHRGLFGTQATAHPAGSIVSLFPAYELWSLDVKDQQSLININSAPFGVILNLLQYAGVSTGDATRQARIAWAISSFRTSYSYWENSDGSDDVPDGTYTPFQNIDMVKNIAFAPYFIPGGGTHAPLTAQELDLIRPYITVSSAHTGAGPWRSGYALDGDITHLPAPGSGDTGPVTRNGIPMLVAANLNSSVGIAVGTVVRFGDHSIPPRYEYRTVSARNRDTTIAAPGVLAADTTIPISDATGFEMLSDQTPGYIRILDPVNGNEWVSYTGINTGASPPQLTGVTRGLWGTVAVDHAAGCQLDGHVISWDSTGPSPQSLTRVYTQAATTVQVENRHAININTVTEPIVLQAILNGVSDGTNTIRDAPGDLEATAAAYLLLGRTSAGAAPGPSPQAPPYNFLDGDEDWFDDRAELNAFLVSLNGLLTGMGNLEGGDGQLLRDNFALDASMWPAYSTVPLRFNSGTLTGIDSLSIADDMAGTPVARSPRGAGLQLARVYDAVPPLEPLIWALRSQKEFFEHILSFGGSTYIMTTPRNTGIAIPSGDANYEDVNDGIGTVAPAVDRLNSTAYTTALLGLYSSPLSSFTLDFARGTPDEQGSQTPDVNNTTAHGFTNVQLRYQADYDQPAAQRNIEADSFHATIQPLAVEFWMRPGADVTSRQLILDLGQGAATGANQVRIYLEGGRLKLRVADEVYGGGRGGYVEATSSRSFSPHEWHHVAVALTGTFKDEMAMFIDGVYDRNMDWLFNGSVLDGSVKEGYFWPIGIEVPDVKFTLAVAIPPGMPANTLTLSNPTPQPADALLPPGGGMIALKRLPGGPIVYRRYTQVSGNVVTLAQPVVGPYAIGDPVATMIPVRRTAVHKDAALLPQVADKVTIWPHDDPSGNGSYEAGTPLGPFDLTAVEQPPGAGAVSDYVWLGIDPANFPLGSPTGLFTRDKRWKVLLDERAGQRDFLAGDLPSGPVGANFAVGADRSGGAKFKGELDELRITSLPTAVVEQNGWSAGGNSLLVQEWEWFPDPSPPGLGAWRIRLKDGPSSGLAAALGVEPVHPSGGYFMVGGYIYSYATWAANRLGTITLQNDDLTPQGPQGGGITPPGGHGSLRRIMTLNWITTTRLPGAITAGDTDIPVVDASQFPDEGYVEISHFQAPATVVREIVAYSGRSFSPDRLLRPTSGGASAYPRGAFNTAASNHPAASIVRHLPVRHLDRYRAGTNWTNHVTYTAAQLDGQMCMFSFNVAHAGRLQRVFWRFKEPLKDGERVAVLVRIDGAVPWNTNPDDNPWGAPANDPRRWQVSGDLLWGKISETAGMATDELSVYTAAGERPTVTTNVEVRFYFDVGGTEAYNRPGEAMSGVELDTVQVEMVPEPMVF